MQIKVSIIDERNRQYNLPLTIRQKPTMQMLLNKSFDYGTRRLNTHNFNTNILWNKVIKTIPTPSPSNIMMDIEIRRNL